MSKVIIIVGNTGTGKTTEAKKILASISMPKYIYDVNKEWTEYGNQQAVFPSDFKIFVNNCKLKTNTCLMFEEATIFLTHAGSSESIRNILVRKRHTNNIIIFNFHALRQVPLYLLDFCNYLILGKTNDIPKNIYNKFDSFTDIIEAFEEVQESEDNYIKEYVKLN